MKTSVKKIIYCSIFLVLATNVQTFAMQAIPTLTSNVGFLCETTSDRVLYQKNSNSKVKIASVTKFMTALIACEQGNLDDMVIISKQAAIVGGSEVGLKYNDKVKLENLLYGLMLESGNDCAIAIAEHVAGSMEQFVELMNNKAKELKAYSTNFTNPHGLDTENNYCTAEDLYKIVKCAIANETISKIIATKTITLKFGSISKYLANTNRLLHTYQYCIGGKTGFTNIAERCLVVIAKKEDMKLVAIILGANDTNSRFNEGKKLLEYGFNNYSMVNISEYMNWYIKIGVFKGNIEMYEKYIQDSVYIPLKEGELEEIYVKQTILPMIVPPAKAGLCLGDISMYISDEQIYTTSVFLEQDIYKNTVLDYMKKGIKSMFEINLTM